MEHRRPPDKDRRHERALWVAREIIPHERRFRGWLSRVRVNPDDVNDLLQEAYCRIALLESVDHIEAPAAYFFSILRSLLIRRLKRQRVVSFEQIAEAESVQDDQPSPEDVTSARMAYRKTLSIMALLPERCRQIVHLRKVEGWSQKQIAAHLDTTEKAVEKQIWLGVRLIRQAWSDGEKDSEDRLTLSGQRGERHR